MNEIYSKSPALGVLEVVKVKNAMPEAERVYAVSRMVEERLELEPD